MADEALDRLLRLVAEGRLSADEAAPLLAALDERDESSGGSAGDRQADRDAPPPAAPTAIRIEVREAGGQIVNLRLPIAVGAFALDSIPGLSGEQAGRVRAALRSGLRGPVLEVGDDADGVRIVLE